MFQFHIKLGLAISERALHLFVIIALVCYESSHHSTYMTSPYPKQLLVYLNLILPFLQSDKD